MRHFLLAVQFFSRIPVTGRLADWVGWSPELQRASAAHLPGVGWLVGMVTAGVLLLIGWLLAPHPWMPLVAAVCSTAAGLWLTGAFHEDGMADVADGLGGFLPAERALEVMKDSRIGAYGAIALVMGLLTKVVLVAALVATNLVVAAGLLCAVHVLSRGAPMVLMRWLPHVSKPATSKTLHIAGQQLSSHGLLVGALWCLPAAAWVVWLTQWPVWTAMLLAAALVVWRMGRFFQRRLGGMTGDCLGATQQICELALYLVALVALVRTGM